MYWQLRISFIYVWIVFFIKFDVILYALELKRKVDVNLDYRKQRKHADLWPQDHQYQMFTETYSKVGNKHQIICQNLNTWMPGEYIYFRRSFSFKLA